MEAKYTRKMQALRDELDLRRKTEIHELEERKNTQISELIGNHEGAFGAIKNYYNDITAKNLTLINLLKVLPVPVPPLHPGAAPAGVSAGPGSCRCHCGCCWWPVHEWGGCPEAMRHTEGLGKPRSQHLCAPKNRSRWKN